MSNDIEWLVKSAILARRLACLALGLMLVGDAPDATGAELLTPQQEGGGIEAIPGRVQVQSASADAVGEKRAKGPMEEPTEGLNRTVGIDDLAAYLFETTGIAPESAKLAVESLFRGIAETLSDGGRVQIVGFGSFSVVERAASVGRNPRTGELIRSPASKRVRFKPAKALREAVESFQ